MYERMLSKETKPTFDEITNHIGKQSSELLKVFEKELNNRYDITKELRFPYGDSYGWSFKFSHKKQHICDVFFENGAITITASIPSKAVGQVTQKWSCLLPKTKKLWEERYPCGSGGWIHYRVLNKEELMDVLSLIEIKKNPRK